MSELIDLTGMNFGKWTVIKRCDRIRKRQHTYWVCKCECGTIKSVYSITLKRGLTKSCGCFRDDEASRRATRHGAAAYRNGKSIRFKEYKSWIAAKDRCCNPNNVEQYKRYGARGIKVCDEWLHDFEKFYADMGPCPNPTFSLDRIDVDKGYCKENCIWSSKTAQARNRRSIINPLKELCEKFHLDFVMVRDLYVYKEIPVIEALLQVSSNNKITVLGSH